MSFNSHLTSLERVRVVIVLLSHPYSQVQVTKYSLRVPTKSQALLSVEMSLIWTLPQRSRDLLKVTHEQPQPGFWFNDPELGPWCDIGLDIPGVCGG